MEIQIKTNNNLPPMIYCESIMKILRTWRFYFKHDISLRTNVIFQKNNIRFHLNLERLDLSPTNQLIRKTGQFLYSAHWNARLDRVILCPTPFFKEGNLINKLKKKLCFAFKGNIQSWMFSLMKRELQLCFSSTQFVILFWWKENHT